MALSFKELQDEVLNHGFDETYRPRVKVWLNEALHKVGRSVLVPDFEKATTLVTTAQSPLVQLPADFIRVHSINNLDTLKRLDPSTAVLIDAYPIRIGDPLLFALDEGFDETTSGSTVAIRLYPTPDKVYNLRVRYVSRPVDMVEDDSYPSLPADHQDLLVTYALGRAFRAEDDFEAATFYATQFAGDLQRAATDMQYRDMTTKQVPGVWEY
jgi:hypothetical protein